MARGVSLLAGAVACIMVMLVVQTMMSNNQRKAVEQAMAAYHRQHELQERALGAQGGAAGAAGLDGPGSAGLGRGPGHVRGVDAPPSAAAQPLAARECPQLLCPEPECPEPEPAEAPAKCPATMQYGGVLNGGLADAPSVKAERFGASCMASLRTKAAENKAVASMVMKEVEKELFRRTVKGVKRYLEWGSGGSTRAVISLMHEEGMAYSAENACQWWSELSRDPAVGCAMKAGVLKFLCTPGTPLRQWGMLQKKSRSWTVHKYVAAPDVYMNMGNYGRPLNWHEGKDIKAVDQFGRHPEALFDVVLVDGRFRTACAFKALHYVKDNGVVMIHDFGRKEYQNVFKWYEQVERKANLVVLRKKRDLPDEAYSEYLKWLNKEL